MVYDEKVPATSAIASTIAGVENLLPIRYDLAPGSLYLRLMQGLKIPIRHRLINPDGTSLFTGRGTIPGLRWRAGSLGALAVLRRRKHHGFRLRWTRRASNPQRRLGGMRCKDKKSVLQVLQDAFWWAMLGSNQRLLPCEGSTLPLS